MQINKRPIKARFKYFFSQDSKTAGFGDFVLILMLLLAADC